MAALPNNEIPDVRQDTIKRDSAFMVLMAVINYPQRSISSSPAI